MYRGIPKPKQILEYNTLDLSFDLDVTLEDAKAMQQKIRTNRTSKKRKLEPVPLDAFQNKRRRHIFTNVRKLDHQFGGIELGMVTEFVGFPGTGKTQFCFQLCVNATLPSVNWKGLESEVIFIDTQSNFSIARLYEMAKWQSKWVTDRDPERQYSVQKILESIHVFYASSRKELTRLINLIPALCKRFPKVRLVVIDSIVFHLRHDYSESKLKDRASIIAGLGRALKKHASDLNIAVVTTNHFTSKKREAGKMEPEPSLGRAWSEYVDFRYLLYLIGDNARWFGVLKSDRVNPKDEESTHTEFTIRDVGIRGPWKAAMRH